MDAGRNHLAERGTNFVGSDNTASLKMSFGGTRGVSFDIADLCWDASCVLLALLPRQPRSRLLDV